MAEPREKEVVEVRLQSFWAAFLRLRPAANQRRPESHDLSRRNSYGRNLTSLPSIHHFHPLLWLSIVRVVSDLTCYGLDSACCEAGRLPPAIARPAGFFPSSCRGFDRKLLDVGVPGSDAIRTPSAWFPVAAAQTMGSDCRDVRGQG